MTTDSFGDLAPAFAVAGADGCKGGWICISKHPATGVLTGRVFENAAALVHQRTGILAVDIPIGLLDRGSRDCDKEARRLLGRRHSSVFPTPIRPVMVATSFAEACEIGARCEGKKLSKQAWAIVPKIKEMDAVVCAGIPPGLRVREVHPEVSFCLWAGAPMRYSKKKRAGRDERRELVDSHFGPDAFPSIRDQHPRGRVAADDILDAFAALWTAQRIAAGTARLLPEAPPQDGCGLPMEIVG